MVSLFQLAMFATELYIEVSLPVWAHGCVRALQVALQALDAATGFIKALGCESFKQLWFIETVMTNALYFRGHANVLVLGFGNVAEVVNLRDRALMALQEDLI